MQAIWREFYIQILYYFQHISRTAFKPSLANIPWRNIEAEFEAWKDGRTGAPIVDAGMRQLKEIGWMPNRARMIVASYLVKDLLIDWRWGEAWFMQNLIDGDRAANNGNWQWTAGTGTDAAPYFRIFNPTLQSAKLIQMEITSTSGSQSYAMLMNRMSMRHGKRELKCIVIPKDRSSNAIKRGHCRLINSRKRA
jgi:deoxyribodipyrimidine photolyase